MALFWPLSLLQLNLSDNQLCGLTRIGGGTYNAEGVKALADAIAVSASLTKLDVRYNSLGADGKAALQKAVDGRSGFDLLL